MDWAKAKNTVIVVLIITDIFIFSLCMFRGISDTGAVRHDYTLDVLRERGIDVKCGLPEQPPAMTSLTVSYQRFDAKVVGDMMKTIVNISQNNRTEEGYGAAADVLVEKCGYFTSDTRRNSTQIKGNEAVVTYKNYYNNIPLEESYIIVRFNNGSVVSFDRKWMVIVEKGSMGIESIPPASALLKFMTDLPDIPDRRISVDDMYITYWASPYQSEDEVLYDTALPAWCIRYSDKNGSSVKYISAILQ